MRERRPYANGIAQLLDPMGDLFGGRIIAKESLEGGNALQIEKRLMQACSRAASVRIWCAAAARLMDAQDSCVSLQARLLLLHSGRGQRYIQ